MSKVYLESSKIKMYPSANRDHSKDIESYLNTEYHITGPKRLSDVINGWIGTRSVLSLNDEYVICLYGYLFFIKVSDIKNHDTIKNWSDVYCGILVNKELTSDNNYRLVNIGDSSNRLVLDDGTYFRGLAFTDDDTEEGFTHIMQILTKSGGTFVIPYTSKCKLDCTEIRTLDDMGNISALDKHLSTGEIYANNLYATNHIQTGTINADGGTSYIDYIESLNIDTDGLSATSGFVDSLTINTSATIKSATFEELKIDATKPVKITSGSNEYLLNKTSSLFANTGKDFVSIAQVSGGGEVARGWEEIGTGSLGIKNDNSDSGSIIKRTSRGYFEQLSVKSIGGPFSGVLYGSVVPTYATPVNNALLINTVTTTSGSIGDINTKYIEPLSGSTKKALISYSGKVEYGVLPIASTDGNLPSSRLEIDNNMIASNHSIEIQSTSSTDDYYMKVSNVNIESFASMKSNKFNITNAGYTEMDLDATKLTFKFKYYTPNKSTVYNISGITSDYTNPSGGKFNIDINGYISTQGNISSTSGTIQAYGNITSTNGEMYANGYHINSDARLKENLRELTVDSSILDLPTYKFDYKTGKKNQIGCLAQDLQKICPELVEEQENGYLTIQESKLVYLLLEEVKKLRKELDELKK